MQHSTDRLLAAGCGRVLAMCTWLMAVARGACNQTSRAWARVACAITSACIAGTRTSIGRHRHPAAWGGAKSCCFACAALHHHRPCVPAPSQIRRKKEDEIRKKMEEKAQAQAFANALSTIGKFTIKKKTGEKDQIYGSVQVQEVADAIYQQTGRNVADLEITVPEIKAVGTYECTLRLHPEVLATFSVVIQKERGAVTIKTTEGAKKKK